MSVVIVSVNILGPRAWQFVGMTSSWTGKYAQDCVNGCSSTDLKIGGLWLYRRHFLESDYSHEEIEYLEE